MGGAAKTPSPTEAILAQGRDWGRSPHCLQTELRACRQKRRPVRADPAQKHTDSLRLAQSSLSPETAGPGAQPEARRPQSSRHSREFSLPCLSCPPVDPRTNQNQFPSLH